MMLPYTRSGEFCDGPTLVLMHFFGSSRREWREAQALLSAHHPCVAIDMPGFGEANDRDGFDMAAMAQQVATTIETLGLDEVVLVGHSFSGKVAQIMAGQSPAWLRGVILVGSSPLAPQPDTPQDREFQAHYRGDRAGAEQFIRGGCAHPLPAAIFERAIEDAQRGSRAAWRAWPTHGADEDWSTRVAPIALPSLIVVGEKDPPLPPSLQRRMVLPFFTAPRFEIIADQGHLLTMECPQQLSSIMHAFMLDAF